MRSAARLRWAVFGAMALMVALYLSARLGLRFGHARVEYEVHGTDSAVRRAFADGSVVLLMIALYQLTQMLRQIAAGDLFGPKVVAKFRSFALFPLVIALLDLAAPILSDLVRGSSGRAHLIRFNVDFRELLTVGVTLLLFLLARLLERARAIDEEMREIV
jgi:hypothetical protein